MNDQQKHAAAVAPSPDALLVTPERAMQLLGCANYQCLVRKVRKAKAEGIRLCVRKGEYSVLAIAKYAQGAPVRTSSRLKWVPGGAR